MREQHDDDQQEADPEFPVDRIDAGQVVLRKSMISNSAEREKPSVSMPTNCVVCAISAPAIPATAAPIVKIVRKRFATGAPMAGMRLPPSRMPRTLKPNGE